jgi:cytochrome c oxidase subunit 2
MALAIVIILLVVGSLLFHFLSPWWFTPVASNWGSIDTTVDITFWVTGIVFVAINSFMAYAIIKYRHKKDSRAHYEPENKKLEAWLVGITSIGVAAMLAPGLFVWADFVKVPVDAAEIEAVGQQWRWSYRYPGQDDIFGTVDVKHMSVNNPFGLNPEDPNGRDDVLVDSGELHLPVNRPVKVLLRSKDVLHNFTVPQFRVKMDLVPGMVTYMWLTPTRTGEFEVLCEELCGLAHFAMRSKVVVDEEADFQNWLARQRTFASILSEGESAPEAGRPLYAMCSSCHGAQGEGNPAQNAPKLSGLDPWYIAKQLRLFKSGARGTHETDVYGKQMAAMAATLTSDAAIDNIAAYIGTLSGGAADATVSGNLSNGERLYATCAGCHGRNGQGVWSTYAPRLSGMHDWYLARQLNNFKQGVRGTHPADTPGKQMAMLSIMLRDEQAVNDVVAYINTLE